MEALLAAGICLCGALLPPSSISLKPPVPHLIYWYQNTKLHHNNNQNRLPDGVKDVDFSAERGAPGPPLLAATCDDGSCSLWEAATGAPVCALALPKGMPKGQFARCRFSKAAPLVYVAINVPGKQSSCHLAAYGLEGAFGNRGSGGGGGSAAPGGGPGAGTSGGGGGGGGPSGGGGGGGNWVLLKRNEVDAGPAAAMEIAHGGHLLALGQAEGGLLVVDARNLQVVEREPRASMVFVTRVAFADDDGAVVAAGADANVFVLDLRRRAAGGGCAGPFRGVERRD